MKLSVDLSHFPKLVNDYVKLTEALTAEDIEITDWKVHSQIKVVNYVKTKVVIIGWKATIKSTELDKIVNRGNENFMSNGRNYEWVRKFGYESSCDERWLSLENFIFIHEFAEPLQGTKRNCGKCQRKFKSAQAELEDFTEQLLKTAQTQALKQLADQFLYRLHKMNEDYLSLHLYNYVTNPENIHKVPSFKELIKDFQKSPYTNMNLSNFFKYPFCLLK